MFWQMVIQRPSWNADIFFIRLPSQKKYLIRWLICGGSGDQITVLDIVDIITSKGVGWG